MTQRDIERLNAQKGNENSESTKEQVLIEDATMSAFGFKNPSEITVTRDNN